MCCGTPPATRGVNVTWNTARGAKAGPYVCWLPTMVLKWAFRQVKPWGMATTVVRTGVGSKQAPSPPPLAGLKLKPVVRTPSKATSEIDRTAAPRQARTAKGWATLPEIPVGGGVLKNRELVCAWSPLAAPRRTHSPTTPAKPTFCQWHFILRTSCQTLLG